MPKSAKLSALTAVLATYAVAQADIPVRNLATRAQVEVKTVDGREFHCEVGKWDGFSFSGSCGEVSWDRLKAGPALGLLKRLVEAGDPDACAEAATVVLSIEAEGAAARNAIDWARAGGASRERIARIGVEAAALAESRARRSAEERAERLARSTPEAAPFTNQPWKPLHSDDLDAIAAATLEEARALLGRTGGSATLHQTAHVTLLAESGDASLVRDVAALERFYRAWRATLEEASIPLSDQGRIPVILVSDRDRWRLLVQAAIGGDAARFPDALTIYPTIGIPAAPRPIVLVRPDADPIRQRSNAAVGLARAVLHLSGGPARPPAWLNEGLPRVMADRAVPEAKCDATLRTRGLAAIRAGGDFSPVLTARYGEGVWESDPELAKSLSYMLARWLEENALPALLRYAKEIRTSEPEEARFKRIFGMSVEDANGRATLWFRTND